ncbi:hypothetical protein CEP52_004222 [Fusarium oligoseptatum]|uniref:Rho-GAP domain-containing protein n=1 Tax=Fusarium oligoseptatum TaxID=2604345 RepID=A0A428U4X5_9HYPO|nr:hypothetical protein CEP52_004222 [Fusarium oligoseptatum]
MSDPLSTAASVVGLITAAAQISKILAHVIDKARHAPQECSRIKAEVDDIRNVLMTLQLYIVGTRCAARSRTSLIMVEQVVATLAVCVKTFSELDTFAMALQNDSNMEILDRLRWASKDKEIKAVLVRLEAHKSSLTLMLTILTCQSQDDAESRVDKLCDLVEQMLLRDLILKERLAALETLDGLGELEETIDARMHRLGINHADVQEETPDPITATNKQPEWQRNPHGFAFEEILMSSRAYRLVAKDNSDAFSIVSSAGRTASWSMLSGLSLSEVSHIGIQAIPIYASDITNKEHYDFSPSAFNVIQAESSQQSSPGKLSRRDRLKSLFRGSQPLGPELLPDSDPEPRLGIFGVALTDSINCAKVAISLLDEAGVSRIYGYIPFVIAKAGVFLKEKGIEIEDIFATIGSPVRISKLQQAFESPPRYGRGLVWDDYTIHDGAGLMLRYLKSLPEPIIPYDCYVGTSRNSASLLNNPPTQPIHHLFVMSTSEHQHWLAPYEVRHGVRAVIRGEVQLDRDEILHHLRGYLEHRHREKLYCQLRAPLRMNCLSQLDHSQALDFRNKTVPVYVLTGDAEKTGLSGLLLMVLHNYLYRRWFRPYRSNIERGQFVAKVVLAIDQPDTKDEDSAVDLAMLMHATINTRLDSVKAPQFYTTRPLFRAIAIVIPGQSYYTCGLVSRVATMPVLLVLTGEQEGLSAPISFDSIADRTEAVTVDGKEAVRTTLETAVDFIMFLEKREEGAFWSTTRPDCFHRRLGT